MSGNSPSISSNSEVVNSIIKLDSSDNFYSKTLSAVTHILRCSFYIGMKRYIFIHGSPESDVTNSRISIRYTVHISYLRDISHCLVQENVLADADIKPDWCVRPEDETMR
jgi:hypothetical protein